MSFGENFLRYPDLFPARPSGEPWGDEEFVLQIAGHAYCCSGLNHAQAVIIQERFGESCSFSKKAPYPQTSISVFRALLDDFCEPQGVWSSELELDYTPTAVRVVGFYCMGRLDWSPQLKASLWLSKDEPQAFRFIFENFLRIVVAYQLIEHGGLLLHSAAVKRGTIAYVFFGPSEAGKSTISRLSETLGHTILSDDVNTLQPTSDGGFLVEKFPFAGDFGRIGKGLDGAYPLGGLYRLYQGPYPILENQSPARAVAGLFGCSPFINANPCFRDRLIDRLIRISNQIPVKSLTFSIDNRFWSLLEECQHD